MDKYFYFVSQLPFLKFLSSPAISKSEFLLDAAKWIPDKNHQSLSKISIDDFEIRKNDCPVVKNYKIFEKNLRQNLVFLRDTSKSSSGYQISGEIKQAVSALNPLEVEKNIFFLRWKFVDDQEKDSFFNLDYIKLYFLKLQILEALAEFDKDKGTIAFDQLCESADTNQ
jgi:uncharacterized protein DUF2764